MTAMEPEAYVDALYRLVLGRGADPGGLAAWSAQLRASGDATSVLAGLLASPERQAGEAARAALPGLAARALEALGRRPRVVDVGAQLLADQDHVYTPLAQLTPCDVVGFDPLEDKVQQRRDQERLPGSLTLLPYALGDGGRHVLHVNDDDATSSLLPLDAEHNARFNHLSTLRTVREVPVETHRLDDVLPDGPVDLLKLDVQGGELMVLQSGRATLARTAVVHCEVEFGTIYRDQPLYGDVARELAGHGFELVDLDVPVRYSYLTQQPGPASPDRLLWGDAVFVRVTDDPEVLVAQALVAAAVYGKPTLAASCLERAGR